MINCATTLLLSPGIAQIFYGDESGRKLSDAKLNVDSNQAFRSDMNWNDMDSITLSHFRKLGTIRKSNPVISTGKQKILDVHTVVRYDRNNKILIRLRPEEGQTIKTYNIFREGDEVQELYTGNRSIVKDNQISFPRYENNVAILKKI